MASKSKRRGRVFRASCILAALIIAGSSFAWFTSQDEVTNRLTASSDYGVSIVESFTPPKNWLPGQEINKDVYAVNTGSVDAFVKETVAGVLDYTYEDKVAVFGDAGYNYVKLDDTAKTVIDGVTTEEAGGYLIWTNAIVNGEPYPTGSVNSRRVDPNHTDTGTKDPRWTPPATGDYIFLRSNVDGKYTYAGYHAVVTPDDPDTDEDESKVEYYKIVIGNDPFRAKETINSDGTKQFVFDISVDQDKVGVVVNADGTFASDPAINYVILSEVDSKDVNLTYVAGASGNRDYLLATYSDGMTDTDTQALEDNYNTQKAAYETAKALSDQDSAKVADAQVDYSNAEGEYNLANKKYKKALADYNYALSLANARNTLIDAADSLNSAHTDRTNKHSVLDAAWGSLVGGATTMESTTITAADTNTYNVFDLEESTSPILNTTIVPTAVRTVLSSVTTSDPHLGDVKQNLNDLDAIWTEIDTLQGEVEALLDQIDDTYDTSHTDTIAAHMSDTDLKDIIEELNEKLAELKVKLKEYQDCFANLERSAETAANDTVTNLIVNPALNVKADIGKYVTSVTSMCNSLDTLASTYYTAYTDYVNAVTTEESRQNDWEEAVDTYNDTVNNTDGAGKKYADDLTAASAITYVPSSKDITINNAATTVVPAYSANTTSGANDASIDTSGGYPDYTNYVSTTLPKITTTSTPNVMPTINNFVGIFDEPTDPSGTAANTRTVDALSTAVSSANSNLTNKKSIYDSAKAAQNTNAAATQSALTAMNNAKANWVDHMTNSSNIAIKVYLDDAWNTYWEIDSDTNGTTDVDFYLKKVLLAGETSHKLIDGVELVNTVGSKDYKDLTFDLNVGLKSAQVTYDADQRGYATDAVDADANFAGMTAKVDYPLTEGSTVTWTDVEGVPAPATP